LRTQGFVHTTLQKPETFPSSPIQQLASAAVGVALLGGTRRRGGPGAAILRVAGVTLIGMAVRPVIERKIRDAGARRRQISSHTSVEIERPVPVVFSFFKDFESFPRVVGALRSVIDYADGRSHWEAYTPSGAVASWDVVVTKFVPNSVIGWQSVPGSVIDMRGVVRFVALGPTRTRVDLEISYRPVRTGLSDAFHAIVARRPAEQVDGALEHARFYLESLPLMIDEPDPAPATQ
jgi:uncharacterized membrane protein